MTRKSSTMVMAVLAGCACSATQALAQQSDAPVTGRPARPHAVPAGPVFNSAVAWPISVEVNGVQVPFTLGEGGAADSQFMLYDNLGAANNFASTTHRYRTLDDFGFAGGQSAVITGLRPAFATPATTSSIPTTNVTIEFQFFGGFNPAVTPVNGAPASNSVRVTYGAPAGGWAVSTVYTGAAFILATAGNNITASGGAVDVRVLRADTLVAHPEFDPAFCGAGVATGTSTDSAYFDINSDGVYQGADAGAGNEAINFGGGAGQLANLRLAIQGRYLEAGAGACCIPGGSCVILTNSQCTGLGGTYNGDGSTCAGVPGHCATGAVLHNNGPLSTGPTTLSGVPAPAGSTWCEGVQDTTCTTTINGPNVSGTFRISDDFTVPAGKQWAVNKLTIYAYASPGSATTSPVTGITLRIWNGSPANPASTVVFGDTTTNLYVAANAAFTNMYRCFNTGLLTPPQTPGLTRPLWSFGIPLSVTLPAGSYWIDYSVTGGPFGPQVTMMTNASNGVRNAPAANALQFITAPVPNTGTTWQLIGENGAQANCLAGHYDMPFIVEGAESTVGGGCYANCDASTTPPVANVADFTCFLQKFAANDPYANCDGSTIPPVVNVGDFTCFLQKFAAGCP